MFFSVIIPVYNSENTIDRCLKSVSLQRFNDYEVIIVDDGSKDTTGKICNQYVSRDKRFIYYFKENGGVSSARNLGLTKASGTYITFLDSDDEYQDNYLASFYELIQRYSKREHYWCGYRYISNQEGKEGKKVVFDSLRRIHFSDRSCIMTLQEKELVAPLWNKAFVRDILMKNKITMPLDLSLGEDYIFNLKYLDCCNDTEIIILNEANYRYYGFSDESLNSKYRRNLWNIYNSMLKSLQVSLIKWGISEEQKTKFYNTAFYMYDHVLRNTFSAQNRDSLICKIRYNNRLLRSKRFRKALKLCNVSVNKNYLRLYSFGKYELLLVVDNILKMIKHWKKKKEY